MGSRKQRSPNSPKCPKRLKQTKWPRKTKNRKTATLRSICWRPRYNTGLLWVISGAFCNKHENGQGAGGSQLRNASTPIAMSQPGARTHLETRRSCQNQPCSPQSEGSQTGPQQKRAHPDCRSFSLAGRDPRRPCTCIGRTAGRSKWQHLCVT